MTVSVAGEAASVRWQPQAAVPATVLCATVSMPFVSQLDRSNTLVYDNNLVEFTTSFKLLDVDFPHFLVETAVVF